MSEVTFTASSYLHMRHLLTPKHLELAPAKRKQQLRDKYLLQPPAVAIRESKLQFLRPLAEIETIMRHFDAKFHDASLPRPPRQRHRTSSSLVALQHPSDKKMSELINLPTLKAIKQRAESLRNVINAEQTNQRNERKCKIMDQFQTYLQAELKISPNSNPHRGRMKTIM